MQTLADSFQHEARPALPDPFRFLKQGMTNAHYAILDYTEHHRLRDTPRTTCVACVVQDNVAYWAHSGDSRLFLMRGGKVISRTRDHSRIQFLIDEGLLSEAQAAWHPDRNKIYSCLGSPNSPEIEFSRKTPLNQGDILLLCTDGLWGEVSGEHMAIALKGANLVQAMPLLLEHTSGLSWHAARQDFGDRSSTTSMHWPPMSLPTPFSTPVRPTRSTAPWKSTRSSDR